MKVRMEDGTIKIIDEYDYIACYERPGGIYEVRLEDGSKGILINKKTEEENYQHFAVNLYGWLSKIINRNVIGQASKITAN
jgi:hypothetical protein